MTLPEFLLARIAETDYSARDSTGWASLQILRDCAAKRRIVEDYVHLAAMPHGPLSAHAEWVTRTLAAAHADHPDYREEWKP